MNKGIINIDTIVFDEEEEKHQKYETAPDTSSNNQSHLTIVRSKRDEPENEDDDIQIMHLQSPPKFTTSQRNDKIMFQKQSEEPFSEKQSQIPIEDMQEEMEEKMEEKISYQEQSQYSSQSEEEENQPKILPMFKTNVDKLILMEIPPGFTILCMLRIEPVMLGLNSIYHLYLKHNNCFLLSGKKELLSWVNNFNISKSKMNHSKRNQSFICCMRSNFSGTEWKMFHQDEEKLRLNYEETIMGSKSIRVMNVIKVDPSCKEQIVPPLPNILSKPKKNQKCLLKMKSRQPQLIDGKYKLDFHGLAKKGSNKNFILYYGGQKEKKECMVFGKQHDQLYMMEVRYPLTILEGFCLSLSSLSGKILVN